MVHMHKLLFNEISGVQNNIYSSAISRYVSVTSRCQKTIAPFSSSSGILQILYRYVCLIFTTNVFIANSRPYECLAKS